MGLLDKILGRDNKVVQVINAGNTFKLVGAYEPVFTDWKGCIYEAALVRAAIDARARHASKLKAEILGTAKPDLCARLKRRPNPWDTWSQFLYRVSTMLDVFNNVLLVPVYDSGLTKIGFFPVLPREAKLVEYNGEIWVRYSFRSGREKAACKLEECALLKKFQCTNDFFGDGNQPLNDTIDLLDIQRQGIKNAVKNRIHIKTPHLSCGAVVICHNKLRTTVACHHDNRIIADFTLERNCRTNTGEKNRTKKNNT